MKRLFVVISTFLVSIFINAQINTQIKYDIVEDGLEGFLADVSEMNAVEDPISPIAIASKYSDQRGFVLENKKISNVSLVQTLELYKNKVMLDFNTDHIINANEVKVTLDDPINNIYTINCDIIRYRSCRSVEGYSKAYEDRLPITFLVKYMPENETKIIITSINCDLPDEKDVIIGQIERYHFDMSPEQSPSILVTYRGEGHLHDVDMGVRSYKEIMNVYANGVERKASVEESVKYTVTAPGLHSKNEKNETIIKVPYNDSRKKKNYELVYKQEGSEKTFVREVQQEGRPYRGFFSYDDNVMMIASYHYGLNQPIGLSMMYGLSDNSRFYLGAFGAFRFTSKGWSSYQEDKINITTSEANGYTITQRKYAHNKVNYSELMDPDNKAELVYNDITVLANMGCMVNNYMMVELGLGAAASRKIHYMEVANDLTITDFLPQDATLPEIPSVYDYSFGSQDYSYTGKVKWSFASRIGCRGFLNLGGRYNKHYLSLGIGYNYVPDNSHLNSLDFNIGIKFEY